MSDQFENLTMPALSEAEKPLKIGEDLELAEEDESPEKTTRRSFLRASLFLGVTAGTTLIINGVLEDSEADPDEQKILAIKKKIEENGPENFPPNFLEDEELLDWLRRVDSGQDWIAKHARHREVDLETEIFKLAQENINWSAVGHILQRLGREDFLTKHFWVRQGNMIRIGSNGSYVFFNHYSKSNTIALSIAFPKFSQSYQFKYNPETEKYEPLHLALSMSGSSKDVDRVTYSISLEEKFKQIAHMTYKGAVLDSEWKYWEWSDGKIGASEKPINKGKITYGEAKRFGKN